MRNPDICQFTCNSGYPLSHREVDFVYVHFQRQRNRIIIRQGITLYKIFYFNILKLSARLNPIFPPILPLWCSFSVSLHVSLLPTCLGKKRGAAKVTHTLCPSVTLQQKGLSSCDALGHCSVNEGVTQIS